MLCLPLGKPVFSAPSVAFYLGLHTRRRKPVGRLPSADVPEVGALSSQLLMEGRPLHAARGLHRRGGVVGLVHLAQALHNAVRAVLRVGLVGVQAVDVHARDVHVGPPVNNPVRHQPTHSPAREDAHRVEAGGHKVVLELRGLAQDGRQVWREALRPAEELAHANLQSPGHPAHGLLQEGAHAVPVRLYLPKGEVVRDAVHIPGRGLGLEQAHQQAASLRTDVGVRRRVFYDRPVWVHIWHVLCYEVVVLCGLVGHGHAGESSKLPSPHTRAVHDVLRADVPLGGRHARHAAIRLRDARDGDTLEDLSSAEASALGQGHGGVHWVHPPVVRDVEAREHVLCAAEREEVLDLPWANF
mmetsp:Transcript_70897/g.207730  ORF Transcript_70897/g.207730 Transcript_70897/m.207730 type:complete len:356 (+) Transcript_70897:1072-2139(+)